MEKGNKTNGLGIAALILGIIAVLLSCVAIGGFIGVVALILGIIGVTRKDLPHGTSIAGIVLGTVAIGIVAVVLIFISDDGSKKPASTVSNVTETETSQSIESVTEDATTEVTSESAKVEPTCGIGSTWNVDGQWNLTINSITETEDRNQFSDKTPAQVFIIEYTYENIGYEDKNGFMDGLFIDLSSSQIIDSTGYMGYSYPGNTTKVAQETPIGAKCVAQSCIAVDNESKEIKLVFSKYDGTGSSQKVTFVLPIE